jgi:hypothetical protein
MKRTVFGVVVLAVLVLTVGTVFASGGTKVCLPGKEGKPIVTPKSGVCKPGYTLTELGAEGKEGPAGKEGKEGPKGEKGPPGASGFAAAVTAGGSVLNGKISVSNPSTGEYVIHWESGVFPICATIVEAQQIATIVTPVLEGPAVMADVVTTCEANAAKITVTIFSNTGARTQNGFSLISLKAA